MAGKCIDVEFRRASSLPNKRLERTGAFAGLGVDRLEGSMTRSSDQTVRQAGSAPAAQAQIR
jgi:hypothetical protein